MFSLAPSLAPPIFLTASYIQMFFVLCSLYLVCYIFHLVKYLPFIYWHLSNLYLHPTPLSRFIFKLVLLPSSKGTGIALPSHLAQSDFSLHSLSYQDLGILPHYVSQAHPLFSLFSQVAIVFPLGYGNSLQGRLCLQVCLPINQFSSHYYHSHL